MNAGDTWLRIAPDHPALAGHFPGAPIVPGALLLDEALHSIDPSASAWHIASAKFHRVVRPGEPLRLGWQRTESGELRIEIHAADVLVVSASASPRAA